MAPEVGLEPTGVFRLRINSAVSLPILLLWNPNTNKMVNPAGFEPALFFAPNEAPYQTRRRID